MTVYVGRREFLGALGGTIVAWPLGARAQVSAKKRALIGWLSGSASKVAELFADDLLDGMRWCYRRGAYFIDKILHGTPPGELPVEFPTKMMLSVNLKTAKALHITVPPALLGLADEVIE